VAERHGDLDETAQEIDAAARPGRRGGHDEEA
jgi:hypothetical protein